MKNWKWKNKLTTFFNKFFTRTKSCTTATNDNVITTAKLIAVCALNRTESRGGHFRTDYPEEHADWKRRTLVTLDQANAIIPDLLEG